MSSSRPEPTTEPSHESPDAAESKTARCGPSKNGPTGISGLGVAGGGGEAHTMSSRNDDRAVPPVHQPICIINAIITVLKFRVR